MDGWPQVTQEGHFERAGERGKRGPGREGETMDGLRGRGSPAIWHLGGLKHRRT